MNENEYIARIISYERSFYRIARTILWNDSDCEDAIQQAVFVGWQKRGQLRDPLKLKPWLTRILINECRNIQRKNHGEKTAMREIMKNLKQEQHDRDEEIESALIMLPEGYRLPIVLYYLEGYSTKAISKILGIPEGRLRFRMHIGRKKLKELLKR